MAPRDELTRQLVRDWLAKADEDLAVAQHLLSHDPQYLAIIAFHAQQAAEKHLKAALVRHQVEFPKTHDIQELLNLIGCADACLAESLQAAAILTPYGAQIRYPSDLGDVTRADSERAVEIAVAVRDRIAVALRHYLDDT
jgi:HEPN domain-containing protein